MPYTNVEAPGDFDGAREIWSCNDCGAYAASTDLVVHHGTCKPGESEKWEEFYTKANEEEEAEMDILMRGACSVALTADDVDILDGSINRSVRLNTVQDAEVKRLYHIYKSL